MTTTDTEIQTTAHRIHDVLATQPADTITTFTPTGEAIATRDFDNSGIREYNIAEDETHGWVINFSGPHLTETQVKDILDGAFWAVEQIEDQQYAGVTDLPLNEKFCHYLNVFCVR